MRFAPVILLLLAGCGAESNTATLTEAGVGKVRIGMTPAEAGAALGAPLEPLNTRIYSEDCWQTFRADGTAPGVVYMIEKGRITRIDVFAPEGKSQPVSADKGLKIGAAEADVIAAYGARLVTEPHKYVEGGHYLSVRAADGKRGVLFETENGHVIRMRTGERPALDYVEGCL